MRLEPDALPCRLWEGYTNGRYGTTYVSRRGMVYIHRLTWEQTYGPIPDGINVLHKCDTPLCYEATHLFLGTHLDNMADCKAKGRLASPELTKHRGEANGRAKLTREQADEIRRTVTPGGPNGGVKGASRRYGVSRPVISGILNGVGWR